MTPSKPDLHRQARQLIARLELISHGTTRNYAALNETSHTTSTETTSTRPPGGIHPQDDREHDYPQKSYLYFRRRLAGARTPRDLQAIVTDAQAALGACTHTAQPPGGIEPERGTFAWKRMIANSGETAQRLSHLHRISVRTVHNYRAEYRTRGEAA